jgi:hypothetical protein
MPTQTPQCKPGPLEALLGGTFSDDGRTIAAYWERSENGQPWQRDFDIRYTKAGSA